MSQLDLFGPPAKVEEAATTKPEQKPPERDDALAIDPPERPKPPKPRPKPKPEPPPDDRGPIHAGAGSFGPWEPYDLPCIRCGAQFEYRSKGTQDLLCANCAGVGDAPDPLPDVKLEERCILIACACVTMGVEIDGHPVCNQHDTDRTREIIATGAWPAWYGYEGKWRVVPTIRRLDDLGHTWVGVGFNEKHCETCGMRHAVWVQARFETACKNYEQPDTTKGLFRP